MKKLKYIKEFKGNEDDLFEMDNVMQGETGLPMNVYISAKNVKHGPRIKVQNNYSTNTDSYNLFTITISDTPKKIGNTGEIKKKDIDKVKSWILLNKELLLDYWYKRIESTRVVLNTIKKI